MGGQSSHLLIFIFQRMSCSCAGNATLTVVNFNQHKPAFYVRFFYKFEFELAINNVMCERTTY